MIKYIGYRYHILLCLIALLSIGGFFSEAQANVVNLTRSDISDGDVVATTSHARFILDSEGYDIDNGDDGGLRVWYRLPRNSSKIVTLKWEKTQTNGSYSIQVTKITFKAKAYTSNAFVASNAKVSFNGGSSVSVGTAELIQSKGFVSFGGTGTYNNNVIIQLSGTTSLSTFDFHMKDFQIEYTIIPDAPTPIEQTIYVTVDQNDKQTADLGSSFTLADPAPDFTYTYEVYGNYGNVVHRDGNTFWADEVGDYVVRAKVNGADDHAESAWAYSTIHVRKWPNTLKVNNSADYNETMALISTMNDVWLSADNTDYSHYPIVCTQVLGQDSILYDPLTGVVMSGPYLVTAKWHITQSESPYYEAGDNYFTVTTVNQSFVFYNTTGDKKWSTAENWLGATLPDVNDNVHIRGNLTLDEERTAYLMSIENGAVVTIAPNGGLTIGAGGIVGATTDNLILAAGQTGEEKGQTGYLRISPYYTGEMPNASVQLYSIAYFDYSARTNSSAAWQYVGSPLANTDIMAKTVYKKNWIYSWSESEDEWSNQRATLKLSPFVGYATTQDKYADGSLMTHKGQLVSNQTKVEIDLAYSGEEKGHNMIANSFAAPINISQFDASDFVNAEATIYIFNTGSQEDAMKRAGNNAPGQYTALAINTLPVLYAQFGQTMPNSIPAMQGFTINATGTGAKLKLDYSKLVWGGDYSGNTNCPLRVKSRHEDVLNDITGALQVTLSSGESVDQLYMLESHRYDKAFENGNDARKIDNGDLNVFAVEGGDRLAVDATGDLAQTRIGVRTGDSIEYMLTFSKLQSERPLALHDAVLEQDIEIEEGSIYTFYAVPNSVITDRFTIVEAASSGSAITTNCDNLQTANNVHKFIKDGQLYVLRNGSLYNAQGLVVR